MLQNIQRLRPVQRLIVFILIFGGGLFALIALTVVLISGTINTRTASQALTSEVKVREFAALPDNDAYPAALAVAGDGSVYTGSYKSGALWKISPQGAISEVPGSREALGAISGLAAGKDGSVYIVDQDDADPRTSGGRIQRLNPDGTISLFAAQPDTQGFVSPDDIALDGTGNLYVSDRGRDVIWRFTADGTGTAWWTAPTLEGVQSYEPTGLAYDASHDALLVTDGLNNLVYRVSLRDASSELLYQHGERPNPPGLDGVTITPEGAIYIAALGQNGIARLEGDALVYVAGLFRGSSDVDYDPETKRLYVTNFDSASLAYPVLIPRLPFALDVIELSGGD